MAPAEPGLMAIWDPYLYNHGIIWYLIKALWAELYEQSNLVSKCYSMKKKWTVIFVRRSQNNITTYDSFYHKNTMNEEQKIRRCLNSGDSWPCCCWEPAFSSIEACIVCTSGLHVLCSRFKHVLFIHSHKEVSADSYTVNYPMYFLGISIFIPEVRCQD